MRSFMISVALMALFTTSALAQQRYIQLVAEEVPIRFNPSATGQLVATGQRGDVFRLSSETAQWFEIYMFSGEGRYVTKAAAKIADYKPVLPDSISRRHDIYRALGQAEDRSFAEADRGIPHRWWPRTSSISGFSTTGTSLWSCISSQCNHPSTGPSTWRVQKPSGTSGG
jgi:hypothetical protein